MKKIFPLSKAVLRPLAKKFKEAGCQCSIKKDKRQTVLTIGYANIISLNPTRPTDLYDKTKEGFSGSGKVAQLSKALHKTVAGKKTDETCYSEPIPKWLKRKAVVENKLKEHERRI